MKNFVLGFFTALLSFVLWVDYSQYQFMHEYSDLRNIEWYNSHSELIMVQKTPLSSFNNFIQNGYLALPLAGRCSNKHLKKYPDMTAAEYNGCDMFQRLINRNHKENSR